MFGASGVYELSKILLHKMSYTYWKPQKQLIAIILQVRWVV